MARAHVILADEVLDAVDDVVGERGRSRFLEQAAREKLARMALEKALGETFGVLAGKDYDHWRDRRTTAAWVRKLRRPGRRT